MSESTTDRRGPIAMYLLLGQLPWIVGATMVPSDAVETFAVIGGAGLGLSAVGSFMRTQFTGPGALLLNWNFGHGWMHGLGGLMVAGSFLSSPLVQRELAPAAFSHPYLSVALFSGMGFCIALAAMLRGRPRLGLVALGLVMLASPWLGTISTTSRAKWQCVEGLSKHRDQYDFNLVDDDDSSDSLDQRVRKRINADLELLAPCWRVYGGMSAISQRASLPETYDYSLLQAECRVGTESQGSRTADVCFQLGMDACAAKSGSGDRETDCVEASWAGRHVEGEALLERLN